MSMQYGRNHIVWECWTALKKLKVFLFSNFLLRLYSLRLTIILLQVLLFTLAVTQAVNAEFLIVTKANHICLL